MQKITLNELSDFIQHENEIIDESRDIIMWSLSHDDPQQWYFGLDTDQQSRIGTLIDYNDNEFKLLLDNYKYATRYPELTEAQHREKAEPFLQQLNLLLSQQQYLTADKITRSVKKLDPNIQRLNRIADHLGISNPEQDARSFDAAFYGS